MASGDLPSGGCFCPGGEAARGAVPGRGAVGHAPWGRQGAGCCSPPWPCGLGLCPHSPALLPEAALGPLTAVACGDAAGSSHASPVSPVDPRAEFGVAGGFQTLQGTHALQLPCLDECPQFSRLVLMRQSFRAPSLPHPRSSALGNSRGRPTAPVHI